MKRRDFMRAVIGGSLLAGGGGLAAWSAAKLSRRGQTPPARQLGAEFRYDVSRWTKTDPSQLRYRLASSRELPLTVARALALGPAGELYLVGDRHLWLGQLSGGEGQKVTLDGPPTCLAINPAGELLIGVGGRLGRWSASGEHLGWLPAPAANALLVSVAAQGEALYQADATNKVIYRCDAAGRVLGRLGERDTAQGVPGLVVPSPFLPIRLLPDGRLWVSNPGRHRLERYQPDGTLELAWGRPGMEVEAFCGCCNPVAFDLLPDGRLVAAEKGLPRVKLLTAENGQFDGLVAGPEAFVAGAYACAGNDCRSGHLDLACDGRGWVWILQSQPARLYAFEPLPA